MLNVVVFTFNLFEENTYLISNENNECWIVDPGMYAPDEVKQFTEYIDKKGLKPVAIINTHTHLDHIFGVQALKDKYGIPFGIHEKELPVLQMCQPTAQMFGFDIQQVPVQDFFIKEGTPLRLGADTVDVRFVPGHSTGSIAFYYAPGNWVIGGDVLFNGSIGRTDLPGGSFDILIHSIRTQMFTLPGDTKLLSGHGHATTIKHEIQHNPFLNN